MADLKEARVPDLGGSSEVPVIELLVKVGDVVKKDQGLVTLESDKATMEVPSAFAGIVREVKVKLGDELSEGSLVAIIEADAAPVGASPGSRPAPPPAPAPAPAPAPLPAPAPAPAPISAAVAPSREPALAPTVASVPHTHDASQLAGNTLPYASPAVRLFARELGVDLTKVTGSARGGRITRDDVQNYVKAALAKPVAAASGGGNGLNLLPWP
ncbi:MAG TPA: biotin/lipoyl-containing protein, partial [Patescibacteria group bacterium]|nr:biotin/lipoyl-containing protein [Patescibacteria group bacterium]